MNRRSFLAAVAGALTAAFTKAEAAQAPIATTARGALLKAETAKGFVAIGKVTEISLQASREIIDVTSHDTAGHFREYLPGELHASLNFTIDGIPSQKDVFHWAPVPFRLDMGDHTIELQGRIDRVAPHVGDRLFTDVTVTIIGEPVYKVKPPHLRSRRTLSAKVYRDT